MDKCVGFDFSQTVGYNGDGYASIEDGPVVVTFPSGKRFTIVVDPEKETLEINLKGEDGSTIKQIREF